MAGRSPDIASAIGIRTGVGFETALSAVPTGTHVDTRLEQRHWRLEV
jgi:hypothetical protein